MPYITHEARDELDEGRAAIVPGELNYQITRALLDNRASTVRALIRTYWANSDHNYQALNDIIGAVFGALMEMDRRLGKHIMGANSILPMKFLQEFYKDVGAPYEEDKRRTNGDVYRT